MTLAVAHVVPDLRPASGGPSQNVPRLCAALGAHGLRVELHTLGPAPFERADGLDLQVAAPAWPPRLGRSPQLRRALQAARVDVVHAHALWMLPLGYAAQAARARGVPLVISPRGMLADWALARSRTKKRLARWLLHPGAFAQAAGWHATSEQEVEEIRRQGFTQPVCVAPNGIEPPAADPPTVRAAYAAAAPRTQGRRVLLFYSRLHSKKRVLELLEDFAALAPGAPAWHLLVVGIPEEYDVARLERRAAELGLREKVTVLDGRPLPPPYALAELFVLPTHNENFGRVVAEALASGVPVLTTTGTPWGELESSGAGRHVPLASLRGALGELLERSPEDLQAMGARGRAFVLERYDWRVVSRPLVDFYRELLERGGRR